MSRGVSDLYDSLNYAKLMEEMKTLYPLELISRCVIVSRSQTTPLLRRGGSGGLPYSYLFKGYPRPGVVRIDRHACVCHEYI